MPTSDLLQRLKPASSFRLPLSEPAATEVQSRLTQSRCAASGYEAPHLVPDAIKRRRRGLVGSCDCDQVGAGAGRFAVSLNRPPRQDGSIARVKAASIGTSSGLTRTEVGIITHKNLVKAAESLGKPFDARIVRVAYYGSGQDRASNTWYQQCDLIIVAGTPRVNSHAIRQRLWQYGLSDAALTDGDWGELRWRGQTQGGIRRIVNGRGYRNREWRQAARSLIRANIIQAAGRGRPLSEAGCDVLILSNEECGVPLDVKSDVEPFPQAALAVLNALSAVAANSYLLGTAAVTSQEVANYLNRKERQVRAWLKWLHERELIHRIGERRGYWPLDIDGQG